MRFVRRKTITTAFFINWIFTNFCCQWSSTQAVAEDKEYFTDEEMHYIKDKLEFENIRFRTIIIFMMDIGCHREEALAIKFSDINKFRETISIKRAFVKSRIDNRYI